ncbi:serine hydrolase domain-containing protein [Aequorivita capsosiphonis]|uniref:serine hydrolase domain-containing protein n=1 Tax=Aequorivita capsosiphonis TaxID=487317 RepID=UPI00040CB524|nr:serine hydrolase domain-containing protein [Aequorivita capsosiphonis]
MISTILINLRVLLISFICCISIYSSGIAQNSIVKTELDSILTAENQKGNLNGSVLVVKNQKIIFEKSYGYVDGSKTQVLNKHYRFNLGSVFKEFPGVAIMQLEEMGKLKLSDPINEYLKELPDWSKDITVKNLLQYTSGLPNVTWGNIFENNTVVKEKHLINSLCSIKNLEFKPGTNYLYSTYNPVLLIKIVEAISGQKFSDYAEKNLLAPAKMEQTVFKSEYPYIDRTKMAIPFNSEYKEDHYNIAIDFVLLSSTPRDIYNWFHHLENFKVISKKSLKTLSKEFLDLPEINTQSPLGHLKWNGNKIESHIHHGNSNNYECIIKSFPQEKLTIVILTNREAGEIHNLADKIHKRI